MKMLLMTMAIVGLFVAQGAEAGYHVPLSHVERYENTVVHNGQCASGVQKIFADYNGGRWVLGMTATWRRGRRVLGNSITAGTAIASFGSNGRYWAHTAIYVSQNRNGISVYDQWSGRPFGPRFLRKNNPNHPESNSAEYFYVIEH